MKRIGYCAGILFFLVAFLASALDVDTDELRTVETGSVEFLNYEGPHAVINTRNEIIGIGRSLGSRMTGEPGSFHYHSKYRVIHALAAEGEPGMSADIFILETEAAVDHIRNLRRIIAGYLSSAYGYDFDDSEVITEFITVYNAVHRRDMAGFSAKYADTVIGYLDPEKAGLSTRYDEWPGKTMMLIPLTGGIGKTGTGMVSSEEISSDEVIESLREDEDRGIDARKAMVEIREEEAEAEEDRIAEERAATEEEKQALQERERELEERVAEAEEKGDKDKAAEQELERTREQIAETEERQAELEEEEKQQEERVDRIRDERERIAEDEKAITEDVPPLAIEKPASDSLFLLISERGGVKSGTFVRVDPITGTIKKRAGGISVSPSGFIEDRNGLLAVGSIDGGIVTLLLVNPVTLEVLNTGSERVHGDSHLTVSSAGIYAAVPSEGGVYLGRFDRDLELVDRSVLPIVPYSYILQPDDTVMVQSENGEVLILDAETLEER